MNKVNGFLRIEASTAQRALPIEGATVTVYKKNGDNKDVITQLITGEDGSTQTIALESVASEISMAPGDIQPYKNYDIKVEHPDYQTKYYTNVPIFPGIIAIQTAAMIPMVTGVPNDTEYIIEKEPENL